VAQSSIDHLRLAALDFMGNLPFSGMVQAEYLTMPDWAALASRVGYRIENELTGAYRSGVSERLFPNRLEITMRWVPE
jgi:hypothetical protein